MRKELYTGSIPKGYAPSIQIDDANPPFYNGPAMKQKSLSRLEQLIRETVEGSFDRLLGTTLEPVDVALQLVQAMEEHAAESDAPVRYRIMLHPHDYRLLLEQNPTVADELETVVWDLGRRYGLPLTNRPGIELAADPGRRPRSVQIVTHEETSGVDTTQVVSKRRTGEQALADLLALDAFLVIQGRRHVALDKPLITIGRRPDNDIVLDSPTVSRQHAQIRWRFDRFVIYDVGNRGRTKLNGRQVVESVLQPGDVIALSDALLVYGEGGERSGRDLQSHGPDGNTQILPKGGNG